ncbi:MAG: hypothetical protein WAT23_16020 [Chromatiaceae bacterium]
MNKYSQAVIFGLLLSNQVFGAECKVDGVWYDYASPQCSGKPVPRVEPRKAPAGAPRNESVRWEVEKPAALARCRESYPDNFSMQNGCMVIEESGVKSWQTDFGMPADLASQAKAKCMKQYPSWAMRRGCMIVESTSYKKLYK